MPEIQNPSQRENVFQTFDEAKQYATPSPQYLETASNRLQSRMAGERQGAQRRLGNLFASRGRAGSGGFERATLDAERSAQNATATGLADLELGHLDRRQEGSKLLTGIGAGQTGGSKVFGELALGEGALGEEVRSNQRQELLDFFDSYIRGGNLDSSGRGRGQQFDIDFQTILQEIMGGF